MYALYTGIIVNKISIHTVAIDNFPTKLNTDSGLPGSPAMNFSAVSHLVRREVSDYCDNHFRTKTRFSKWVQGLPFPDSRLSPAVYSMNGLFITGLLVLSDSYKNRALHEQQS